MEAEVRPYCRLITQKLTLWLVGAIGSQTGPTDNSRFADVRKGRRDHKKIRTVGYNTLRYELHGHN